MPPATNKDELPAILARAFVQAWQSYYLSGRDDAISEEIARPALAKHLVAMAKEGVEDEVALAAAGLQYLNSVTPAPHRSFVSRIKQNDVFNQPSGESRTIRLEEVRLEDLHFHLDGSRARFIPLWRVGFATARRN
jgi:hypothetical protein